MAARKRAQPLVSGFHLVRQRCFPSSIEKHCTTLTKKTSGILLMHEKQERETSTGNLRGEGADLAQPVTFYRKEYLQHVLPII